MSPVTPGGGPWVLITGATSGIGLDAAHRLHTMGYRVIATGRNPEALTSLRENHSGMRVHPLDVTDAASIERLLTEVNTLTGGSGVDVLINNAGISVAGPMAEVSVERLRDQFETNFFGAVAMTQGVLPGMMARQRGRIINISSVSGRTSIPMFGAYHSSKHALEIVSDAFRMELAAFGIQVVLIEPGPIQTPIGDRLVAGLQAHRPERSPFAAAYDRFTWLAMRFGIPSAAPVSMVTDVIVKAIERDPPWLRARYVVPSRHLLEIWLANYLPLPTCVHDWVKRMALALTRRRMRVPSRPG